MENSKKSSEDRIREELAIVSSVFLEDNEIIEYTDSDSQVHFYCNQAIEFDNLDGYSIIKISFEELDELFK